MSQRTADDAMRALVEKFSAQIPDKLKAIEEAALALPGGEQGEEIRILGRMAHTLAGSAASFGFVDLGRAARGLEGHLKKVMAEGLPVTADLLKGLFPFIEKLKNHSGSFWEDQESPPRLPPEPAPAPVAPPEKIDAKLVYMAESDPLVLKSTSEQMRRFGFSVKTFASPEGLLAASRLEAPCAVVMGAEFPQDERAGIRAAVEFKKLHGQAPVIFTANRSDLTFRIETVRAGGDAYFTKPVDVHGLIDKLEALTKGAESSDPYRILIVEDDPGLAEFFSVILRRAGMETRSVTDPLTVMGPLVEFNPDLILMDMYMPGCDGIELAKAVRQMEAYLSIPIVFLSSETDITKQLAAMRMGGDDFLTKPIEQTHLISSVGIRAERMRIIRSFMDRDALTGLLNHTKTKEACEMAVERARRGNGSLVFAMIDIDKFKAVNDTYGHLVGDRVILSLSRFLQQRLRKTDVIGRYGGEEFAVVLLDSDLDAAEKRFDGIRGGFSEIRHEAGGREFSVTVSCGIAAFPCFGDSKLLCNAADEALYEAKRSGRNRLVAARG